MQNVRRIPLAAWGGLCLLVVLAATALLFHRHAAATSARTPPRAATQPQPLRLIEIHKLVPPHTNFTALLASLDLTPSLARKIVTAASPVYNLAHIRAGNSVTLFETPAGELRRLSYQIDTDHRLFVQNRHGVIQASIQTIPTLVKIEGVSGTVNDSLFTAVENAGEHDQLALDLADIFGWDMDFYTDPRAGDVFRVVVEKKYQNGHFVGYGRVLAAEYINAGTRYDALLYHDSAGEPAYYMPTGRPMKREFLRSPLKFAARITSGFSYHRYHPILKRYMPHLGIDFAAPAGTPVQTIGSGVVVRCGRFGGDGNMVQVRHAQGYQTLYLHLSRILVRRGEHVKQGQRIGLVGMTGLATGPHLDFRIEHHGRFENFEVLRKKLPPAAPVLRRDWSGFVAVRSRLMPELAQLQPGHAPSVLAQVQGSASGSGKTVVR